MKNKKSTKRALLLSALSLLLCMAMLVGSTFAWFTDSVTSGRNTIVSGQLDVELEYATLTNGVWSAYAPVTESTKVFSETALYEPGYTEVVKFKVVNAGTLALKYNLDAKVYHETAGTNVYNESFNLSEYLYTGTLAAADYTREAAVAAATTKLSAGFNLKAATQLLPGATEEIVLVLTMPTTVGNEANHIDGKQPKIDLGISLIATQATYEADDFDNLYDENAQLPVNQAVTAPLAGNGNDTTIGFTAPDSKVSEFSAVVPEGAVADDATELVLTIQEQAEADSNVTIAANQTATTYEIKIDGIAAGNTTPIQVTMNIGAGLTDVLLYHNGTLILSTYNATTGDLSFETTSFSPYTVVSKKVFGEVTTAEELTAALKVGGNISLCADIEGYFEVPAGVTATLNLNGHTLTAAAGNICAIKNNGTLTVVGSGEIIGSYSALYSSGYLTVNGGNFTATNGFGLLIDNIYGTEDSVAVINGGTFTGVGVYNPTYVTVNGGVFNVGRDPDGATDHLSDEMTLFVSPTFVGAPNNATVILNGGVFNGDVYVYDDGITETVFTNNGAVIAGDVLDNA